MTRRFARLRARLGLAVLSTGLALASVLLPAAPVAAATSPFVGDVRAIQSASGALSIGGWAFDRRRPSASIGVSVWVDGRRVRILIASAYRPDVNRVYHVTGRHGFHFAMAYRGTAHRVVVRFGIRTTVIASRAVTQTSSPGSRIISYARLYIGRSPYVYGGASPAGFDCSGYTMYVYRQARVASLPHSTDGQRGVTRLIARSQARPGDLVFYMSGGSSYHVAIYAGNGMQYAAATPQDGLRYQAIWSSAVEFRTDWH